MLTIMKKYKVGYAAAALILASTGANAVIDVTAVTTGIADAGVAVMAILTALLALSTGAFGLSKVYAFVKRKGGGV